MAAPHGVTIRRAGPHDRGQILSFHHALYIDHIGVVMAPDLAPFYAYRDLDAALSEDVDSLLHDEDSVVLVAEQERAMVGYITGHVEEDSRRVLPRKGVVQDWYVSAKARGRGVGRDLMSVLAAVFAESGCQVIESTTFPFNSEARKCHEHLGFHEVQIRYRKKL